MEVTKLPDVQSSPAKVVVVVLDVVVVAGITIDAIAVDSAVSIEFDFYASSFVNGQIIFSLTDGLSDSSVRVKMYGTDELQFVSYNDNTVENGSMATNGWDLDVDTAYHIRVRFRPGATDPSIEATKDGASDATSATDVNNRDNTLVNFFAGTSLTTTGSFRVDDVQIYNTWKTGDEWGD